MVYFSYVIIFCALSKEITEALFSAFNRWKTETKVLFNKEEQEKQGYNSNCTLSANGEGESVCTEDKSHIIIGIRNTQTVKGSIDI